MPQKHYKKKHFYKRFLRFKKNIDKNTEMSIIYYMIKKIQDFIKSNKYAILWTFFYIIAVWFILYFLFNFNLFSMENWHRLLHARLVGFAGFAFGIMILAALPLYISTTTIIARTKKPLFTIPKLFPTKKKEKKEEVKEEAKKELEPAPDDNLPENLPTELVNAFIRLRAREKYFPTITEQFSSSQSSEKQPQATTQQEPEIPIPDNFDFSLSDEDDEQKEQIPVFTDLNFDAEPIKQNNEMSEKEILKQIQAKYPDATISEDIIETKDSVIAVHSDSSFWIADPDFWFAAGKQKASPIKKLLTLKASTHKQPIIYLYQDNIQDLESKISEWQSVGIKVINKLEDL